MQFPAPNDEKYLCLLKYISLQNVNIRLTNHLPQNILAIKVESIWSEICLKTHIYDPSSIRVNILIQFNSIIFDPLFFISLFYTHSKLRFLRKIFSIISLAHHLTQIIYHILVTLNSPVNRTYIRL